MKTLRIVMAVAVAGVAVSAVGTLVTEGPRAAIMPTLGLAAGGFTLYNLVRHQPMPRPWTRRRITFGIAVITPTTAVTIGMLVWTAVNVAEPAIRVVTLAFIVLIPVMLGLMVRMAVQEHRTAGQLTGREPHA